MERVQHIAQSPVQLEWMRREMAIAPITPDQSAADWVVQRINLAKERVIQARSAAAAPQVAPAPVAPKMEIQEEVKQEAKQEVKETGWNGRMDFDGFYNQNNQGNASDWASNDAPAQDDAKWEHPEGQAMPAAYAVKDEYEGPVSTLTAPYSQPIMMNAQASSSTSNGYVTAALNPALLMQPQAQAPPNNLKRKVSPTASENPSGKIPSNKRLIDLSTNNRLATAVDPSNLRPIGSPPRSAPSKSPPPAPSYDFATVKALLTASNLRLHETPRKLMRLLLDNPKNAKRPFLPKPRELVELLKIIRTGGKSFFEALGAELELLKLLAGWYKLAYKDPELWDGVLPPLLQVITRTPITIKNLIESKIGFWVKKKLPDGSSDDLKRKRDEAIQHCEKLIVAEQERSAKRARPDPSSASAGPSKPPAPRPAAAPPRPTPPKPAVTSTDMSFFGAEKPAPKPKALPSFKKVVKPPTPAAPQPSAFASTLGQLSAAAAAKPRSPVVIEPLAAGGKMKKRVRFRDSLGGHLTDVKEFRQEAYEFGDEIDLHGMSSHDMDMEEGKAMRVHGIEEVIDWYDPEPYSIAEPLERGTQSAERAIQDERERTVLAVTYHGLHEIPPSADESQVTVVTENAATGIFLLPQMYPTEQQAPAPPPPVVQTNQNLAELLARIQAGTPLAQMQMQPQVPGYGYAAPVVPQYGAYAVPPQAQGNAWGAPQPQPQQRFDRGPAYGKVRGGGGGVKGSRTQPCRNYMSAGGCRFGDNCDYAHNEPNRNWYP